MDINHEYIKASAAPYRELAVELGISIATISRIKNGYYHQKREIVYLVAGGNLVKIGKTDDINRRMVDLQCGSPVPLTLLGTIEGYSELELKLKQKYAADRSHGEWFHSSHELLAEFHLAPSTIDIDAFAQVNATAHQPI